MIDDPEIAALNTAYSALKGLEPDAIQRNLTWLATRLGVVLTTKGPAATKPIVESTETAADGTANSQSQSGEFGSYATSAEFLSQINEPTGKERVLAVAAFLQKKDPTSELTGFVIHKELKHIGHGVANITQEIQSWVNQRPQLMIQLRKAGTSKQAKKVYKVTEEGIKWVRKRIEAHAA